MHPILQQIFSRLRYHTRLILSIALVVLAAVVGYLPAVVAYRTDVAQALSERP